MRYSLFVRIGLLGAVLIGTATKASAQVQERVYPPAAPTAKDSAANDNNLHDKQQFANQSVLGQGPS